MGSVGRMRGFQLLLVALAAFSSLNSPAAGAQLEVMSAPNLMRVGTDVNIFVEILDYAGDKDTINVPIFVKNHPTKSKTLAQTSVDLTKAGKYQAFGKVKISPEGFSADPEVKQYVTLQAMLPGRILEKVVLVSLQFGYIFIQTDKTIYTPSSNVRYRIFALRPSMEPVESHGSDTESSVVIEIMTPDGIVVDSKTASLTEGIKSDTYSLPSIVSVGEWKVVAKFQSHPQQSYFSEFEVKEYVLPSFEVKLSAPSDKPFFYIDSDSLTISIKAKYVFGEEVDGTAYVVFGVICQTSNEKKGLPKSLQRVAVQRGSAQATLTKEQITHTFQNISKLVGSSIYVAVSVLTRSGGEMVESELRGIKIVTSPYTISFKRTPKFFKPGMIFDVLVEVLNPDGSPAPGIPVEADPGKVMSSTVSTGLARIRINTESDLKKLQITVKTKARSLSEDRQASAYMEAKPYQTGSKSYLHISVDTATVAIGEYIQLQFLLSKPEENDITFLILSRGQLVHHFRFENKRQSPISRMLQFTKHMLPSFRIVAYYHTSSNELVSDSLWVDVQDICMGTLEMQVDGATYEPSNTFKLVIRGDPEATVGLVAVDKAVYVLNNQSRLTQKKIWETVEKYEPGCTAGGGENSMKVFYDAGLLLETNSLGGTPDRTDPRCPSYSRRKRSSTIMDVRTSLLSEFNEKDKECCLDGMRDVPVSYTCERRSEYIEDDAPCVKAFLHCCQEMKKHKDENKREVLHLARSETDDKYIDSDEINSRTSFPESWHWMDFKLDPCPGSDPNCKTTQLEQYVPLPHSITTWQLTAISLSSTHGICVADTQEVKVFKPFFIDLRLPYSAVRGEQLEIKAILHNYNRDPITVRVELKEDESACSAAYKKGWFRFEVHVGNGTTRSVPFIIIPMKDGEIPITVRASVKYSHRADAVEKTLRVVPPGVLVKNPFNVILDPAKKGRSGKQIETIKSEIPQKDMVPNTPTSTLISLTGVEQLSSLFENSISGESMGSLILEPNGCGEQNMVGMTLPVIATIYLDKTNMWEDVGFAKRNQALQHISSGYQKQLKFRKPDGSFAIFERSQPTTWLTAYVAKVFAMSYKLVVIDSSTICGAIKFLILNAQQPDGMFKEIGSVYEKHMIGDVGGVDTEASMTAFCLIAMQESQRLCSESVNSMPNSMQKAVAYLERRLPRLTNPYAVAMTSYALANENKLNKQILYKFASTDQSHWPVPKGHIYTLETTAYALLALVKAQDFEHAKNVVRWLSQQQKAGGGYGSTQATIMVYQAVAEYWANAKEPPYELDVDILLPERSLAETYRINRKNHYQARSSKFDGINKDVKVTAKGTGEAIFRMVSLFYAMPATQEGGCKMFNLSLKLTPEKISEDEKIFKLQIEILYKNKEKNATMTILDVGLPTGYSFSQKDLEALSSGKYPIISKYEVDKELSERSSLMIYLKTVSSTQIDEITFRIEQKMKVGILQPAAVSIYEYYDRQHCVKFYRPERRDGELLKLCTSETCKCAEENCSKQKKEDIQNDQRTNKACESTSTSKIDFVYKVNVEHFKDHLNTDIFYMRVLEDIKVGSKDAAPRGQLRTFLSYQHCRDALDLKVGKDFLIMGSSSDIHKEGDSFQYVLGENSWIEYWPTSTECQDGKYESVCEGMEYLKMTISVFGCQMK